jgi:hypothetical protein
MRTKPDYGDLMVDYIRSQAQPVTPEEAARRSKRELLFIDAQGQRARNYEKAYGLLAPGTIVRPDIKWLRYHWLEVASDPGPLSDTQRMITIKRREPDRDDEVYRVRRDRVRVQQEAGDA